MNLAQGVPTIAVGQSLKTARELMGKSVDEVAQHLRIRQPFLEALEDGRHKDLPGGAYAIGFLRTYAEFLGLDGEEMVRRFRAEAAGDLNPRSELVFPSPVSEGRIPGGAVLFLGLLLAGLAYGVWYFLSSRSTDVAEMVPPLPDRLASALNRPATVTGDTAKTEDESKAEDTAPTADAADQTDNAKPDVALNTQSPDTQGPDTQATTGKDSEVVPPAEEDEAKGPVTATPANTPQADAGKLEAGKVEQPKAAPSVPPPTAAKAPVAPPAPTTDSTPPAAAQPSAATPSAEAPAIPAAEGKVIGQEHADSRVQLKAATDDCWVQVREMDGQLLLSRLLRKGDSYMVPNRPGLTLMVGNAGALDVLVDGKKSPSLGSSGQVRRDIKLDPDKLLGSN